MNSTIKSIIFFCLILLFGNCTPVFAFFRTDSLPRVVVEEWRQTAYPNNVLIKNNTPVFLWPSEKRNNGSDPVYKVYLSRDPGFLSEQILQSPKQRYCFYNPHQKLAAGKWYWKYDIINDGKTITKGTYTFTIDADATGINTPDFKTMLSSISPLHPRVMNQGRSLQSIQEKAPRHPLYKKIIEAGEKVLSSEIYRGPVGSKDPAEDRAFITKASKEITFFNQLLEAYLLSGDKDFKSALLKRTDVLLTWPTDDLLGSQVLTALSRAYDVIYRELSDDNRKAILNVIDNQLKAGLKKWPGLIEARHVENHFWQMELAGNFMAALATINDLPSSNEMLEYTYELFLARFPNLATQDGGWAEGIGYFGVNKSAIVDMALVLKKVCGVDVFQMNWYKQLADYYLYFAPVNGRISGFGDMHERVNTGNVGHSMVLVEGIENQDERALYRLSALIKSSSKEEAAQMAAIEPWYQVVNDIYFNAATHTAPKNMPSAKMFSGVGLAAMHSNVLNSSKSTSVYFRSSPFGAKGHMHANQNCFNISRKGEPVFYSTGYYTSFADPHSLSSYRHTRAHNGILINGNGQAFGHEGYGWIKRFINNDKIGYVCGDATMAYRSTTDQQFLELCSKNNIQQTSEFGFGDSKLKLFERHIAFVQPGIIVIYDVLEAANPSEWTFLLHTMVEPAINKQNQLLVKTKDNYAQAYVIGSGQLKASSTDQFFSAPIDIKKKYKGTPNQFHTSYTSVQKHTGMRFLAILQLADKASEVRAVKQVNAGKICVGDIEIDAQLDAGKPASLTVKTSDALLNVDNKKSVFNENGNMVTCTNLSIPLLVN